MSQGKEKASLHVAVFRGLIIGLLLVAALVAAVELAIPRQDSVDTAEKNYGYVYSGAKSASVDFSTAGFDENTMLLFGSSELATSGSLIPQVPSEVFGANNYGLNLVYVGEAFDQSLWQSIAAGAYAQNVPNKKVALIVSPTWFENEGVDNETFKLKFSYSLYRAFCANPNISDESKEYVARRLKEQGIDDMTIAAGRANDPLSAVNGAVLDVIDDLKIRNDLNEVREKGIERVSGEEEVPDFEDMYLTALADGEELSTNNDWGIDDSFWTKNLEGKLDRLKDTQTDETFSNETELSDFSFFLDICQEAGLDPLIIVSPVHGEVYDLLGTKISDRQACYDRIVKACEDHSVSFVDFSDREYEQYFLHDIVHFGWTGWLEVDEAVYNHAKN